MTEVIVKDNESLETALKRFKRQVQRDGIPQALKRHEYYEKPSERKKRRMAAARKREYQRMRREAIS